MTRMAAICAAAAALVGCKRGGGAPDAGKPDVQPRLGAVVVQDLTPPQGLAPAARPDPQAIAATVRERLAAAKVFAPGPADGGDAPVARVRIEFGVNEVATAEKAAARAGVRLRIETRPSGLSAPRWNEDVQAGSETIYALEPPPDRKALFAKLVTRTVNDLLDGYIARQRLWTAPGPEVRKTLVADAGELQLEAIRAVAERGLRDQVPALLELLSHPEEAVRDAALGALVELRERRAVGVIAKQRSMRDRREMRKILDAIATLGGDEARDYLSFVADAHDDPEIEEMAKQALARMQRRAGAAGQGGGK